MATAYSSAYEQLPQKPSVYTPKTVHPRIAGMMFPIFWQYTMPAGQANADIIKVCDLLANVPVASPQIAGLRFGRVTLRSAGNVGGSVTVNFGTPASPTLFGAALTTLQSATILDVHRGDARRGRPDPPEHEPAARADGGTVDDAADHRRVGLALRHGAVKSAPVYDGNGALSSAVPILVFRENP
jgi:hypothetical protein